jgi:copper chaperone
MTTQLKIEGMSCSHCVSAVKEALEDVPGVAQAEVDLALGSAKVEHVDATDPSTLIKAVEEEGYSAKEQ